MTYGNCHNATRKTTSPINDDGDDIDNELLDGGGDGDGDGNHVQ